MTRAVARDEAAEYYFTYIDQVPGGNIGNLMSDQAREFEALCAGISEEQSRFRYAPDKWSVREVLQHLIDTERLFVFRAFWFARGFDTPLPSFDQTIANESSGADDRSWQGLVEEFLDLRKSTAGFFTTLPEETWSRRGIASGNPFTVRALAYMVVGHVTHHLKILRTRYLAT